MNFSKIWTYEDTRPAQTRIACVKNAHAPPITLRIVIVVRGRNSVVYKVQYNF